MNSTDQSNSLAVENAPAGRIDTYGSHLRNRFLRTLPLISASGT